jgi:multiple sugar transport system permease protein
MREPTTTMEGQVAAELHLGAANGVQTPKPTRWRRVRDNLAAYAFLSPWIIGFLLFSGLPILASIALSFMSWDMITPPHFIGFGNYNLLFQSQTGFLNSLFVTLVYTFFSVIATVAWALFLAVLLNQKVRARGLYQFFYFVPAVLPSVAIAFVFQLMLNQQIGVVNYLLSLIGINNGPNWLMDPSLVMGVIVFVSLYSYSTGQMMLIFDAALKEVPSELYEAAAIDGANFMQKFMYVTLPSISPVLLFNVVVGTIGAINGAFQLIYPLTAGGPGQATNVLSIDVFTSAFQNFDMGYASAVATMLFMLVGGIAYLQFRVSRSWVTYES